MDSPENQPNSPEITDPKELGENLGEAYADLLRILESIQGKRSGELETPEDSGDLKADIHNILNVLGRLQISLRENEALSERLARFARYKAIVESQTEVICRFKPDGTLTFFNEAYLRLFANLGEVKIGRNALALLPDDQRQMVIDLLAQVSLSQPVIHIEISLQIPGEETRWQQWTGSGNFDLQGQLVELQIVGHDITERKLEETAAQQHNRELSALQTATAALLTTLDPETLLSRILDAAISAIPAANKGMIHLIAQDTGQLEMRASVGYSDPRIRRIRIPGAVGYVAKSVRERTALLIQDVHADPAGRLNAEIKDVHSAVVAPLMIKGVVLGAISLESTKISAFNENDLRLLVSFADTATAAIQNARLHAEVQKLAITDALTGLYNRRGLFELGQREVERSRRYKRPLVAIMMDVDRFKFINDYYGHAAGDQVLQTVAKRCSDNMRRIDILGRLGGDEFTFLLPETDMFTATNVAERVRQTVAERPVMAEDTSINVSVSLGIARATSATPDLDVLISRADAAMYVAKREGRNRVEFG
jgi:diguanylate cyclase (GGDEF)-like protein/PAS domain S-box-containing protein